MKVEKLISTDKKAVLIAAVLFLAVTVFAFVKDTDRDWRYYQHQFKNIAADRQGEDKASQIPSGIQQIWVEDLDRVDRCISCHQGIFWPGLENEEQPYATHPNLELFDSHPARDYGCTICHGGQGYSVDKASAHGYVKFWEEPLLATVVAQDYNISDPNAMIEINCNKCHRYERETEGMPYINLAKDLIQEKACWGCHVINSEGGTIGPDLTDTGEKHAENFDWNNFSGFESVFNWHMQHLDEPQSLVPETVMPKMGLQTKDRQALTMLIMSWTETEYPVQYIPGFAQTEQLRPSEFAKREELLAGDGAFFIEKGCFGCHSVSAYGIKSPTEKGPDLTFAVDDVQVRFRQTLDEFVFDPSQSGTMSIIFSSKVILTDKEKWDLINKLKKANSEYKIQRRNNKNLSNITNNH